MHAGSPHLKGCPGKWSHRAHASPDSLDTRVMKRDDNPLDPASSRWRALHNECVGATVGHRFRTGKVDEPAMKRDSLCKAVGGVMLFDNRIPERPEGLGRKQHSVSPDTGISRLKHR